MKTPLLFIGHGSPMNALENNDYTKSLHQYAQSIAKPSAILCISAHWMTKGTWVTAMENPKTIHDFYGFPEALFNVQYKASGSPELAQRISNLVQITKIKLDLNQWGLDHGSWSILKHMYPKADVPVLQMSLDMSEPNEFHFKLGKEIAKLRDENVLIVASGNIVHNLRAMDWNPHAEGNPLAQKFDLWVSEQIKTQNYAPLVNDFLQEQSGKFSNPSLEHYLPLLYILGASSPSDQYTEIFSGIHHASISMHSFALS